MIRNKLCCALAVCQLMTACSMSSCSSRSQSSGEETSVHTTEESSAGSTELSEGAETPEIEIPVSRSSGEQGDVQSVTEQTVTAPAATEMPHSENAGGSSAQPDAQTSGTAPVRTDTGSDTSSVPGTRDITVQDNGDILLPEVP